MSRPWRAELRIGVCPDRLVLADGERPAVDPLGELARIGAGRRVAVVLSSHLVRYALLPWSEALGTEEEWLALARHGFAAVHGLAADSWHCRVSPAGRGEPRVASAIDASLLERLRAMPSVVSIQPYLMSAFNARRRALAARDGWFVVREPGRAALALLRSGQWRVARTRRVGGDWTDLGEMLERENAIAGEEGCEHAFLFSEEHGPDTLGRFSVTDVTLATKSAASRAGAMTWH